VTAVGVRDGQAHSVYVKAMDMAGGNPAQLSGSPVRVTCASPAPPLTAASGVRRHVQSMELFNAWGLSDGIRVSFVLVLGCYSVSLAPALRNQGLG
jgi:hypothetical protein